MSGGATEIENSVREARNQLLGLQAALRKTKAVRLIGTLAALAIAIIYAFLFIALAKRSLDPEKLAAAAKQQLAEDATLGIDLQRALRKVAEDVYPAYWAALTERLDAEEDLPGRVGKEVMQLAKDVWPAYKTEFEKQIADLELAPIMREQLGQLLIEVGPAYLTAFQDMAMDLELMEAFSGAMKEVADEVGPAYRAEIDRITPEIFAAAQEMRDNLLSDLAETTETWLKEALKDSLEGKKGYIEEKANITPEEVEEKLVGVVLAGETALINVVETRTIRYQADLEAIQAMLDEIPEAQNKDLDYLVTELGKVSLHLLKVNLPEYEGELE